MHYITNQFQGETDILMPVKHHELVIKTLDNDEVIFFQEAPAGGWTHESLMQVQPAGMEAGADAWLGEQWIGSTEV